MLSRLVINFFPRSKRLFISWLQSSSAVILVAPKIKSDTVSTVSPSISHEVMGPDAMIVVFWMLSFEPIFSLSSFTFIKRVFSSSSLSAIRVVSSADLRLLIFLPAILIPACAWCWSSNTLATSCEELTHWKRPWSWEGLGPGGEGGDRGWDGWMASPTQWIWVWVNSRSWWWTGKPGVLRFRGLQWVGHKWETELNWTELNASFKNILIELQFLEYHVLCYAKLLQLYPTLCDPMDYSPPVFSVHRILQARILEWVAISSSKETSWLRDQTHFSYVSCIGRWLLHH